MKTALRADAWRRRRPPADSVGNVLEHGGVLRAPIGGHHIEVINAAAGKEAE